ncbi:MAG: putative Ceramide glucosyltransferase [Pedosphaera sp.]|nr:putative Ceramide glucosyltransferase [Pedosphaera sp.]
MFTVLSSLAVLSVLITLWQWFVAYQFQLHQRVEEKSFAPPITLLKPLKGLDDNTMECLRSWMRQEYPGPLQILFGVATEIDPACDLVRQLALEFPAANVQLVICHEELGVNAKVSSLIQQVRLAQHDVIVVSDADVMVPHDFLLNVVAPLRDPGVGLVNCFYRIANPATLATRWEAFATNADFWSQVLQGLSMQPLDFALGAVMATRRQELLKIGGFEVLADYLADDFQLGNRIVRNAGKRIALSPVVVDCLSSPMDWSEAWDHQLRWARTIRVCKPLPYAFSILSNATLWPLLCFAFYPTRWTLLGFAGSLLIRIVSAHTLQQRLGPMEGQGRFFWLAPVKDLLQLGLWIGAFFGNHIVWRGQRFRLQRDGLLVRV